MKTLRNSRQAASAIASPGLPRNALLPLAAFALLLSIPVVKVALRQVAPQIMEGYSYDVAVVCFGLAAVCYQRQATGCHAIAIPPGFLLAWLAIALMMVIRLPASANPAYGWKKLLIFCIFNTLVVALGFLAAASYAHIRMILTAAIVVGSAAGLALPLIGVANQGAGDRLTLWGANPLSGANASFYYAIVLLAFWFGERRRWQRIALLIGFPIALYAIVLSGTRTPLFAIPLIVGLLGWIHHRRIGGRSLAGLAAAAGVFCVLLYYRGADTLDRFSSERLERGAIARSEMASITWKGFVENPVFGNGPGDTSVQITGMQIDYYPHNQPLELANELGIFGLMAYLVLLGYAFRLFRAATSAEDGEYKVISSAVLACITFAFVDALKSGTYAASYVLYLFLAIAAALVVMRRKERLARRLSYQVAPPT